MPFATAVFDSRNPEWLELKRPKTLKMSGGSASKLPGFVLAIFFFTQLVLNLANGLEPGGKVVRGGCACTGRKLCNSQPERADTRLCCSAERAAEPWR